MKNNNVVVITPFSMEAVLIYEKLKKASKNFFVYFFDKNLKLDGEKYKDAYVIKPFYLCNAKVIIASDNHRNEISKQLLDLGYDNTSIVSLSDFDFDVCNDYEAASMVDFVDFKRIHTDYMGSRLKLIKKMKRMSEIAAFEYTSFNEITGEGEYGFGRKEVLEDAEGEKHIFLKRLELDVTSKCSMKCKYCSNMMQYYDKPCDIDKNTVINDLKRVLELVEWIDEVLIIGGEPFMYKDLGYVLNEIEKMGGVENKIGRIELVTNGTIVPDVEVLDKLSKCNVMISISNYGEKSKNLLPLINELCRFKIDYYVMDIPYWVYVEQYVDAKRILSDEELLIKRKEGCCTLHRVIDQGKFYLCCHIKSLDQLHAVSDEAKDCYVNIYNHEAKEQIAKYLSIYEPLPRACSWCNGNSEKQWNENNKISVAEQVKTTLEYTKYGD